MTREYIILAEGRAGCGRPTAVFESREHMLSELWEQYKADRQWIEEGIANNQGHTWEYTSSYNNYTYESGSDVEQLKNYKKIFTTFQKWFRSTYTDMYSAWIITPVILFRSRARHQEHLTKLSSNARQEWKREDLFKVLDEHEKEHKDELKLG